MNPEIQLTSVECNKERLVWADSLKGVLIILVIIGHAIQECLGDKAFTNHLWNYIYSFHMPAFMAVSGYLCYRGEYKIALGSTIWRRFRQLVIPFLLWTVINKCVHGTFSIKSIWEIIYEPSKGLWFLWVLFIISVFFISGICVADKTKVSRENVLGGLCLTLMIIMTVSGIKEFGFHLIAYYFLFYTIGYYIHKYCAKIITYERCRLTLLLVLWMFLAWYWRIDTVPIVVANIPLPENILNYSYRFVTAAIAIYLLFSLSPMYINKPIGYNKILSDLGIVSLGLYTVHLTIIGDVYRVVNLILSDSNFVIIVLTTIVGGGLISLCGQFKKT